MTNHKILNTVLSLVRNEVVGAQAKFPRPFNSAHEGIAVIREEFDELWDEIKGNKAEGARQRQMTEAIQLAAMAVRFLYDLNSHGTLEDELERRTTPHDTGR